MMMHLSVAVLVAAAILGLAVSVLLGIRLHRLKQQHAHLREGTAPAPEDTCWPGEGGDERFAAALISARIRKRLQEGWDGREAPEKYRYAAALVRHGLKGAEIAGILRLAPKEADQLVALANISRPQGRSG